MSKMAKKTKDRFISSTFNANDICNFNFDIWMSRRGINAFVLRMSFMNDKWEPCHVILWSFETS